MTYIVYIILAFAVAFFTGAKRNIGFFWSLFFSIFWSPLIGFIVSYYSPINGSAMNKKDVANKVVVQIFSIILGLLAVLFFISLITSHDDGKLMGALWGTLTFGGTAIYLYQNKVPQYIQEEIDQNEELF